MECLISPDREHLLHFRQEERARTNILRASFVNDNNHLLQFFTFKYTIKAGRISASSRETAFILAKVVAANYWLKSYFTIYRHRYLYSLWYVFWIPHEQYYFTEIISILHYSYNFFRSAGGETEEKFNVYLNVCSLQCLFYRHARQKFSETFKINNLCIWSKTNIMCVCAIKNTNSSKNSTYFNFLFTKEIIFWHEIVKRVLLIVTSFP